MPVPAAIRERCRALLPSGEDLRYVFPARSLGSAGSPDRKRFLVVVTDRSITVLSARSLTPSSVWATYPRRTRLGPVIVDRAPTIELDGMALVLDEEYVAVVGAADAEAFAPGDLPRDPLPDL